VEPVEHGDEFLRWHSLSHLSIPEWSSIQIASLAISAIAAVLVFRIKLGTLKVLAVSAALGIVVALTGMT
jgi:hypothetical protein